MLIRILKNRITGEIIEKDCYFSNNIHYLLQSKLRDVKINNKSLDDFCYYISFLMSIKHGLRKISEPLPCDIGAFTEDEYLAFMGDWEIIE